jgi:hypothetical protein
VVPEVRREPDVGPEITTVGGGVPEDQRDVELEENDQATRRDDADARPPPSGPEVTVDRGDLLIDRGDRRT